ncbi:hypothetical protein KY284_028712 [Solanum tuberosum]|nr:hypothetical protein KY284_028712 [Solanum tuberosum]
MSLFRVTFTVMMSFFLLFPRSNSSFFLSSVLLFCLFSSFLLATFYSLCFLLGSLEFCWGFLERLALSLGGKALSFFLRGLGCSGALALAIAWFLQFCISESSNMMAPSGASGSGSGEGAGGSRFRWASELADLFGSSSPANSEAGLNQPAPDRELAGRLTINTIGCPLPEAISEAVIKAQFQTEFKIEEALRSDRVQDTSLFEKRHLIRGEVFYPFGKPLSLETYLDHLSQIENYI